MNEKLEIDLRTLLKYKETFGATLDEDLGKRLGLYLDSLVNSITTKDNSILQQAMEEINRQYGGEKVIDATGRDNDQNRLFLNMVDWYQEGNRLRDLPILRKNVREEMEAEVPTLRSIQQYTRHFRVNKYSFSVDPKVPQEVRFELGKRYGFPFMRGEDLVIPYSAIIETYANASAGRAGRLTRNLS